MVELPSWPPWASSNDKCAVTLSGSLLFSPANRQQFPQWSNPYLHSMQVHWSEPVTAGMRSYKIPIRIARVPWPHSKRAGQRCKLAAGCAANHANHRAQSTGRRLTHAAATLHVVLVGFLRPRSFNCIRLTATASELHQCKSTGRPAPSKGWQQQVATDGGASSTSTVWLPPPSPIAWFVAASGPSCSAVSTQHRWQLFIKWPGLQCACRNVAAWAPAEQRRRQLLPVFCALQGTPLHYAT